MSNLLKDHIEEVNKEVEKYSELKDDAFELKTDITVFALGGLIKSLKESIDEYCEDGKEKKYYDETFGEKITGKISELITAFSKIKPPTVNISPNVTMDLKPLQGSIDSMTSTNKTLIGLVEKISNGNNSDELYRLIVALVNKQNIAVEQINYKEDINKLTEAVSRPLIERIDVEKDRNNLIKSLKPVYKNAK